MKETLVKIFISYKNMHQIIKSDVYIPIQTGRDIAKKVFKEMIGDNIGNNISRMNEKYNELTAQYWVWKNYAKIGNPKYVGFMHYRRHFIFNYKEVMNKNYLGCVEFDSINNNYKKEVLADSGCITNIIRDYDIIVGNKIELDKIAIDRKITGVINFSRWALEILDDFYIKDYDLMLEIVKEKFPEYTSVVNKMETLTYNYWYNMFIMKKELFFEYCNFLFTVEKELDKRVNSKNYNPTAIRFLGYLGERLLTIFILKAQEDNHIIKELPISFVHNCEKNNISTYFNFIRYFFLRKIAFSSNGRRTYQKKYQNLLWRI